MIFQRMSRARRALVFILMMLGLVSNGGISQEEGVWEKDLSLDSLLNMTLSTSARHSQLASETPASTTVITAEEIRLFGYRTLGEALGSQRGFYVNQDHNYFYLGVRGFGRPGDYNSRVLLLLNGQTMNDPVWGSSYLGTEFSLGLEAVDRIEVVRGPASALYGTGAMLAVVNVITKDGRGYQGTHVAADAGTNGSLRVAGGWESAISDNWAVSVSAHAERDEGQDYYFAEFDSPETNGGIARDVDRDRNAGVSAQISYMNFSLQGGLGTREKAVPTASYGTNFSDPRTKTTDGIAFVSLGTKMPLSGNGTFTGKLSFVDIDYAGEWAYDYLNNDESCGEFWDAEGAAHWDFQTGLRLTAGFEVKKVTHSSYRSYSGDNVFVDADMPYTVFSGFIEGDLMVFRDLSVVAGVRFDGYQKYSDALIPRAGLVYLPTQATTLKLLYGQGYRVPAYYEAYYEDSPSGIKSNPSLKPERIQTLEAAAEQRLARAVTGKVSLFTYTMHDLIDLTVDPVDSFTVFMNQSRVTANGLEAELLALDSEGSRASLTYSYVNARDGETGSRLTNSPVHCASLSIGGHLTSWLTASAVVAYGSDRTTIAGPSTSGFWTTNVRCSVTPFSPTVRFDISARNLFNSRYSLPAGPEHVQVGLPQRTRIIYAGISVTF